MMQHRITPWVGRFRVVSGLLVCISVLLLLLSGAGALPPAQAQEPDVSAALTTITRSVSGSVTFVTPCYDFSGTSSIPLSANATVSQVVQVKAGSAGAVVRLKMTANLNSAVPINIYVGNPGCTGGTASSSSANMSGSAMIEYPPSPGYLVLTPNSSVPLTISASVPVSGSKSVNVGGSTRGVYVYTINQPIYGTATIELLVLSGSATFPLYAYLPMIARQEQPAGGAWSDDFSSNKGWVNYKCTDPANNLVNCDCTMELKDGRLRITLDDKNMRCFVAPPSSVQLREGVFSVEARKRNDNKTWYGLLFNVSTQLHKQRWALEARPYGGSGCAGDKGLVWLSYITDGLGTGQLWNTCTDALKLGKDEWNKLTAVRQGDNVKVYINDQGPKIEQNNGNLKDQPFFDLEVISEDETPVVVEFDNFVLQY